MTNSSFLKVATVTVLTGSLGACSFPFMKLPQAVTPETQTTVAPSVAPVVQQQAAPLAAAAPTAVATPAAVTSPTAAEIAEQERLEREERRRERNDRIQERRERTAAESRDSSDSRDDDDGDRDIGWNP